MVKKLDPTFNTSSCWCISKQCPNVSTTPLRQCLPFSWTTLRGKHCRHPIAIIGVVDTFGQSFVYMFPFQPGQIVFFVLVIWKYNFIFSGLVVPTVPSTWLACSIVFVLMCAYISKFYHNHKLRNYQHQAVTWDLFRISFLSKNRSIIDMLNKNRTRLDYTWHLIGHNM